jgi:hypothetical protein
MKIKYLVIACLFVGFKQINAQTGIGISNPDRSAQLDISSDRRGLLMPRIKLEKTTEEGPVLKPVATGLMVYNTQKMNDVVPGFYYWDETKKWVKVAKSDELSFDNLTPATTAGQVLTTILDTDNVTRKVEWRTPSAANVGRIITTSTNYTVLPTDYTIVASQLTGDITITLPDAGVNEGRMLSISQANVANASGDEVTVKFNMPVFYSDTLSKNELFASFYSPTGESLKIMLQSNGTNWIVIKT